MNTRGELYAVARVDMELRKRIQQARMAKKMTQAELAKVCDMIQNATNIVGLFSLIICFNWGIVTSSVDE
jgi:hypothetical protein